MIKKIIKLLLPPIFLKLINRVLSLQKIEIEWKGAYKTWGEALSNSTGYDSQLILEKVKASLLEVKNGNVACERDGVVFNEIQYSWPLLTGLMYATAKNNGKLNILDFGGSLGSTYYQTKKFLDRISEVSWSIIDQPSFVECGEKNFANESLHFYETIEQCINEQQPDVLLLSSVLQYIEDPYLLLNKLLAHKFKIIVIDRTPFSENNEDIIKIQKIPPSIYSVSYPCWFFSESRFKAIFTSYQLIESFHAFDSSEEIVLKGFIYELKK